MLSHPLASATLAFFGPIGPWEMIIIGIVALLLFGKRLPEVGKSLGKGIVEFKKGLKGIEDEIDQAGSDSVKDDKPRQLDQPPTSQTTTTRDAQPNSHQS
jgi:sec-independent protein translocase protein TatA